MTSGIATSAGPQGSSGLGGLGRLLVLATAVLCGAAVMEIEVLGARVVSPWFGVSLFVWTALITVTLLALAAGYFLGGQLADRRGDLRTLSFVVGAAGLLLMIVPWLRAPVLQLCARAGIRGGALFSALILFGAPLTLLGMVTPFVVKLFLRDVRETGSTVGRLSALSTVGSFLGTVATGFWLIPAFHVDQIAGGSALVLLLLAGGLLSASLRKARAMAIALPALCFLQAPPLARTVLDSGTRAEVVFRQGSFYGPIRVVDYTYPPNHTREMLIGGIIQGGLDVVSGEPVYPYDYFLERAALSFVPQARRALIVGLGPGVMTARLAKYGLSGTVVEIDPRVAEVARDYFGFRQDAFKLAVADGRHFLETTRETYDLVLLDAFSAETEPSHMFTREAFQAVKRRLNPGGGLVINLAAVAGGSEEENRVLNAVLRTMQGVFPEVSAFGAPDPAPGAVVNFTLVGSLTPGTRPTPRAFLPPYPPAAQYLEGFMATPYRLPSAGEGYTDDWCPMEAHGAATKLKSRKTLAAPPEILLD